MNPFDQDGTGIAQRPYWCLPKIRRDSTARIACFGRTPTDAPGESVFRGGLPPGAGQSSMMSGTEPGA